MDAAELERLAQKLADRANMRDKFLDAQRQLDDVRARIRRLQERLAEEYDAERQMVALLKGLSGQNADVDEARRELEALCKVRGVLDLDVWHEGLVFRTSDIVSDVLRDGTRRWFGRFEVLMSWDGWVHIRCLNKDVVKDPAYRGDLFWSYEHPHVFPAESYPPPQGNVCWGNVGTDVEEFIRDRQFAAAATLIVAFLHTVHDTENYPVDSWRIVPDGQEMEESPGIPLVASAVTETGSERTDPGWRWEVVDCGGSGLPPLDEGWNVGLCRGCRTEVSCRYGRVLPHRTLARVWKGGVDAGM